MNTYTFCSLSSFSQQNPIPYVFPASNLWNNLSDWDSTNGPGTHPTNRRWHRCGVFQPLLADPTTADYSAVGAPFAFRPTFSTAIVEGLGVNGFTFTNKTSTNYLGAFVIGLNTTGKTNLTITFNARETNIGSLYNVRLQYRLSRSSPWISFSPAIEFTADGVLDVVTTTLGPFNLSGLSGNAIDNRANMQLRLKFYYVSGAATSTKVRIDDVNISCTDLPGNSISTDSLNIPSSGFCITPTIGSNFTFPFKYFPVTNFVGATFTAQLSDSAGSFASPVNIGTIASTAPSGSGVQLMNATIPANTPSGNGYRVRVISTLPAATNISDNVYDFPINLSPTNATGLNASCGPASSTITWSTPAACYDEVMVVASLSPTSTAPSGNGSAYTAVSVYGNGTPYDAGYLVYKGNGTNTVVTNLVDGYTYFFKIWVRYGSEWSSGGEVFCTPDVVTKVVVSSYFNANTANNEWTELLVTGDNVDLRGWALRDNNTDQDNWQPAIVFNNIPLWNHLRRGTVIMIWHRTTGRAIDVNLQDGYIEVEANPGGSNTYFTGGDGSTTLNVSGTGDIIEILSPGLTHVHGLGHLSTAGSSWTSMSTPKLNHALSIADGEAVFACPASNIYDYNGPPTGNAYTGISNSATTFGLPNCAITNETYWKSLRQPLFTTQTVNISTFTFGTPGSVTFTWNPCIDPYTTDNYVGYLILRNTANNFTLDPSDGKTYGIGSIIGSAEVVGIINNSTTATFTDNTVTNGFAYYYRVYAFRYGTDDKNGDEYNVARGRAFNETNFVSANWIGTSPLPVELLDFSGKKVEDKIALSWTTSTETNNDYFLIEKRTTTGEFIKIGKVKGSGNSSSTKNYGLDDFEPNEGINYYGLTQFDLDGTASERKIAAVNFTDSKSLELFIYPNPVNSILEFNCNSTNSGAVKIDIYDCLGRIVMNENTIFNQGYNHFQLDLTQLSKGCYFVKAESEDGSYFKRIIKQ